MTLEVAPAATSQIIWTIRWIWSVLHSHYESMDSTKGGFCKGRIVSLCSGLQSDRQRADKGRVSGQQDGPFYARDTPSGDHYR